MRNATVTAATCWIEAQGAVLTGSVCRQSLGRKSITGPLTHDQL